jgi:hypothetical protein
MEEEPIFYPVCQHIKDGSLYFYRGNNVFESIVSKKQKTISDEAASKILVMLPNLSEYANEFVGIVTLLEMGFKLK